MLPRQCIKLSCYARAIFNKNIRLNRNAEPLICHNRELHLSCRVLAANKSSKGPEKVQSPNDLRFSGGPMQESTKTSIDLRTLRTAQRRDLSSDELLEKLMSNLSSDIHQKNRVYKNDFVRVVNKVKELNLSSKKQGLLLIKCCTELLPDETPSSRVALVEQLWNILGTHTKFDVDHYNELLRVYIANGRTLKANVFLTQMGAVKPNLTTYELILRVLGEAGDINQCTEVISNMKAQGLPATESVFVSLIICQGKAGNLDNIQEILTMMKSLQVNLTVKTYTAIARAFAWNKKNNLLLEELAKAQKNGIIFGEVHIMEIVKTLAAVEEYGSVQNVLKYLPEEILTKPSITPYMQSVSTQLVFQNHAMVALEIYKCLPLPSFGPKDDTGLHGRSLVRDCVKASMPSSVIGLITQELMASGRNPIALHNAAEAALQLGKVPLALDLFTRMKQLGMPVRPHYFWPILLHTSKSYGEKGIMNTLSTMVTMEIKPDFETIMEYTLPYVSFTSPQNLMKKFLETGLTVSNVLTPMIVTLLNTGQVRAASEICELFQGKVDTEVVLQPLIKGYLMSNDVKSTVHLLEDMSAKAADKSKDWVGRFLCGFMRHRRVKEDLSDVLNIAKALQPTSLKISSAAVDYCIPRIPKHHSEKLIECFKEALVNITDERLVYDGEMFAQQMPHPKQMNEASLKAHLVELEAKSMNTRGVLRKLLQEYCKDGNLAAARAIVEKCEKEGVHLSAGMKASIFDLHVKMGEIDSAELVLADLNKTAPNFTIDEFKVIDFATLMVYRKQIKKAFDLINEQSMKRRVIGGRAISMNCWRLLDVLAAHGTHEDTKRMFELLTSLRYCKPSNSILGPLVRVHLKTGNYENAVQEFVRISEKYNKTPLKHELLCKLLKAMSDGKDEDTFIVNEKTNGRLNKLVHTILNVDKRVHGASDVHLTLIAALADVGYKKSLRKLLLDPTVKFHPDALMRHCERFADEKKVNALEAIAECANNLRHFDVEEIYNMMLGVYQRDDNCQEALSLWYKMQESEITPSQKFVRNLCALCKANNKQVPSDIAILLDKQTKIVANKAV
ncbi:leucine-rich PPR motif-containing protein, mitochondrial-like [Pararge aegeria]|uniref:leucine-rich PPR motif-containing protein, mitochondrial-like n=1 Tax=Pararge aegeria TaxID=116150 RepID=UPI0019D16198|nr:leucine-rich PPR motif-containing protein, mitochondrial-like [Pararge aegeria]